jgi:hypothetical protein
MGQTPEANSVLQKTPGKTAAGFEPVARKLPIGAQTLR